MHKQLYIFNPWHDMALANFTPYYKVSSEILRMEGDLCFLPAWYAPEDAFVMAFGGEAIDCFCRQVSCFKEFARGMFTEGCKSCSIVPWGWSPALVHMLSARGADVTSLPDDTMLAGIRYLSGRQRCVEILSRLSSVDNICGEAFRCDGIGEVKSLLDAYGGLMLKAPWSGSGRGLCRVSLQAWNANIEGWISRILRTQGCIMAEPIYNKVCDFAMEFCSSPEGKVSFAGYSLFETDVFGNYKQNMLMSDAGIEGRLLSHGISVGTLHEVRKKLSGIFGEMLAGHYTGYFGVDMMLCGHGREILLHPCVEVNLRMNMGVVARIVFDRYVSPSSHGVFVIEHYNSDGEALAAHERLSVSNPLLKDGDGRISGGYLTLTPVSYNTRYHAYIIVGE